MPEKFSEIDVRELNNNVFKLINEDWMLITAGNIGSYNMMTASWGGQGVLWDKNVCFCFVRPTRHTYQFIEKSKYFTLSFFNEKYRDILNFCGTNSGNKVNKMSVKGLTARKTNNGNVCFDQADLVIECKKIYFNDINPQNFIDAKIEQNYPKKDYHRMYVGEIVKCFKRS